MSRRAVCKVLYTYSVSTIILTLEISISNKHRSLQAKVLLNMNLYYRICLKIFSLRISDI